jgi:threonyl-tRNA synthetase
MLVVGDKETASRGVSVRERKAGDLGALPLADFLAERAAEFALPL